MLEKVGVRFGSSSVTEVFASHGAKVDGDNVFIHRRLVEEAIATTPKQDYTIVAKKRVVAATPFSNAPFIIDDKTGGIRRCNIDDAIKMFQINETSSLYECTNPGCADPVDNDAKDQFVSQVAMALKYSDKYPSIGLRANGSNSLNGDVYGSARRALRLVREFYDTWDEPVMTQGICPNPPLAYDRESLANLCAAIDEKQAICLFPCTLSFMTGPETIMGTVIHDFAMCLAGLVFIQLKSPQHPTSLCEFSTMSDMRTMQPAYGSSECVYKQVIFYELCKHLGIPCTVCGSYGDGTAVDYQAGMESILTAMLPFSLTELDEVWCYPGILSGFSCGSFHKAILDEEMMHYVNHMLKGVNMAIDPNLPNLLQEGVEAGSFLGVACIDTYKSEHYLTKIFNKWGVGQADNVEKTNLAYTVEKAIENRINEYQLPHRTASQIKLLEDFLPSKCK